MARRRMFSDQIVCSDAFTALPDRAQTLYIQLNMKADDDGFINNALQVARSSGKTEKDIKTLLKARFILEFDGIVVIKHWRMHNSLKRDRSKLPTYPGIASQIYIKPNKSYTDHPVDGCPTLMEYKTDYVGASTDSKNGPFGFQTDSKWKPNRTEENRTEENRTEENRTEQKGTEPAIADSARAFAEFFEIYPKQYAREEAYKVWMDIRVTPQLFQEIMQGLSDWKYSQQWQEEGGRYIPFAAKWLAERRWASAPKRSFSDGGGFVMGDAELEAIWRVLQDDPA